MAKRDAASSHRCPRPRARVPSGRGRGPRGAADRGPGAPRGRARRRGGALVHDAVRAGLDPDRRGWRSLLDPDLALGTARDARPAARVARRPGDRGAAGPDPARDPLLARRIARPGRRRHLLRVDRRHAAVRDARARAAGDGARRSSEIRALLPAVDAALAWVEAAGDPDGDGYVEYAPAGPGSLGNQGWKDSHDAIELRRRDDSPRRRSRWREVQAYAYAAWRAGAALAAADGDDDGGGGPALAGRRPAGPVRAGLLARRTRRRSRWPSIGTSAPSTRSPRTWAICLWAGIVADQRQGGGRRAVARLAGAVRAGGASARSRPRWPGYSPLSYHNGSVWPHDTAICDRGAPSLRVHRGGASDRGWPARRPPRRSTDGCPSCSPGSRSSEMPVPVRYPTSCSPQAWASAAPLLVVRALLGLEPDVPAGRIEARSDTAGGGDDAQPRRPAHSRARASRSRSTVTPSPSGACRPASR